MPTYVRFHLFGVKSSALSKLKDRPPVASVDSMAWSSAARWEAFQTKQPKDFVIKKSKLARLKSLAGERKNANDRSKVTPKDKNEKRS